MAMDQLVDLGGSPFKDIGERSQRLLWLTSHSYLDSQSQAERNRFSLGRQFHAVDVVVVFNSADDEPVSILPFLIKLFLFVPSAPLAVMSLSH